MVSYLVDGSRLGQALAKSPGFRHLLRSGQVHAVQLADLRSLRLQVSLYHRDHYDSVGPRRARVHIGICHGAPLESQVYDGEGRLGIQDLHRGRPRNLKARAPRLQDPELLFPGRVACLILGSAGPGGRHEVEQLVVVDFEHREAHLYIVALRREALDADEYVVDDARHDAPVLALGKHAVPSHHSMGLAAAGLPVGENGTVDCGGGARGGERVLVRV